MGLWLLQAATWKCAWSWTCCITGGQALCSFTSSPCPAPHTFHISLKCWNHRTWTCVVLPITRLPSQCWHCEPESYMVPFCSLGLKNNFLNSYSEMKQSEVSGNIPWSWWRLTLNFPLQCVMTLRWQLPFWKKENVKSLVEESAWDLPFCLNIKSGHFEDKGCKYPNAWSGDSPEGESFGGDYLLRRSHLLCRGGGETWDWTLVLLVETSISG